MRFLSSLTACAVSLISYSTAQQTGPDSTFDPARPPDIPLAVRSPYLSTWQQAGSDGGNGGYLAGQYPSFWTGSILGWVGIVKVDGQDYTFFGAPNVSNVVPPVVNQTAFSYTSTRSIFELSVAGLIDMTVTFLSGVFPTDFQRQSFPISFMDVQVQSKDDKPHNVSVYTDISAEWISGYRDAIAQWNYGVIGGSAPYDSSSSSSAAAPASTPAARRRGAVEAGLEPDDAILELAERQAGGSSTSFGTSPYMGTPTFNFATHYSQPFVPKTSGHIDPHAAATPPADAPQQPLYPEPTPDTAGGIAYHKVYRQEQLLFSEEGDQTEYGYWFYLTNNTDKLTHQQGSDEVVRSVFLANGYLNNSLDTNFRAINDSYPVFAFAYDFGAVTTPVDNVWAIALAQELAVQFDGANGNETLKSLWTDYFDKDTDAVEFYFNDYENAVSMTKDLDDKIKADSDAEAGANYTLLTTLAVRQAFGALEYANTTDNPLIFLKEISSDGNVNTVDVIFPFHPITIYLNPDILRYLLDPIYINSENFHWPFQFTIHDIGARFPNATGHDDGEAEMQPLEECGNIIIMTLAYAQRKNDTEYLNQHYTILRQWNDYLVNDSLIPANQISTDDFAGSLANQTNLAVKGIIGIEAMAVIANLTGHFDDGANFTNISHTYIDQWVDLAAAAGADPPHTTLNYGNDSTYSLLYNIFPDKELGLGLVPQQTFDQQSDFYPAIIANYTYGAPLDTRGNYTKSDWQIYCASVASPDTKAAFIDKIASFVSGTPTNTPLTDLFYVESGDHPVINNQTVLFENRPVVGGFFAPLALQSAPQAPVSVPGPSEER